MYTNDMTDAIRYAMSTILKKWEYDFFYGKRLESPLRKLASSHIKNYWFIEHKFHGISKFPDTRLVADALEVFRGMDYEEA